VVNENSTKRERINYMFDEVQKIWVATIGPISKDWLDCNCLHCKTIDTGFSQWVRAEWEREQTLNVLDELNESAGLNAAMKSARQELLTTSETPFVIDDLPFTGFWKEVIRMKLDTLSLICPHLKGKSWKNWEHRTISDFLRYYIKRSVERHWGSNCEIFSQRMLAAWIAEKA
jgi:hypothetical protein